MYPIFRRSFLLAASTALVGFSMPALAAFDPSADQYVPAAKTKSLPSTQALTGESSRPLYAPMATPASTPPNYAAPVTGIQMPKPLYPTRVAAPAAAPVVAPVVVTAPVIAPIPAAPQVAAAPAEPIVLVAPKPAEPIVLAAPAPAAEGFIAPAPVIAPLAIAPVALAPAPTVAAVPAPEPVVVAAPVVVPSSAPAVVQVAEPTVIAPAPAILADTGAPAATNEAVVEVPTYPVVDPQVAARAQAMLRAEVANPTPTQDFVTPAPVVAAAPVLVTAPIVVPAETPVVAAPVVLASPVPQSTLSDDTRMILGHIPSRMDTPAPTAPSKTKLERVSPQIASVLGQEAKEDSYESVGLSIKVRRPGLDTNHELNNAYNALMGGDTQRAIEIYENIVSVEPTNEDALFGLAATYHRLGQTAKARPFYGMLLKQNPNHREGLNNFLVLVSDESPADALPELERLQERNPDFSPIPAQIAIVLDKMGYPDRAEESMLRAIELAPDNMSYKYNLAVMLDQHERYADATALYTMLIKASLRGEAVPATAQTMQKRLNFLSAAMAEGRLGS